MRKELKFWRDLSPKEKQLIKSQHKITVVTYDFIQTIYNESKL